MTSHSLVILKHCLIFFSIGVLLSFQKIVGVGQIIHVKYFHIVRNVKKYEQHMCVCDHDTIWSIVTILH